MLINLSIILLSNTHDFAYVRIMLNFTYYSQNNHSLLSTYNFAFARNFKAFFYR